MTGRGLARFGFYLRWSWRDLRQRWLQVSALSLVIALAVGTWAGLGGTDQWRRTSNDRSFAALNVHDIRLDLTPGSFVPEDTLAGIVEGVEHSSWIDDVAERLLLPTQVDASTTGSAVLAPGEIVGVPVDGDDGPRIDALDIRAGTGLVAEGDAVVLDAHFADQHELAPSGRIGLSGGVTVPYSGTALSPEHFVVVNDRGGLFAAASYAVVYGPLSTVQRLSGRDGQVNQVVLTVVEGPGEGVDTGVLADELTAAMETELPDVGFTITPLDEEISFRLLYDDIENDQRFYDSFAGLIFAGATFGAFNLARRLVEAQRRELGVAMALGVPAIRIAARPMLVGLQMAVLGTGFGVVVGLGMAEAMRSIFENLLPLPIWETSLNVGAFLRAAAVGVLVPLAGVAWPVARALRVPPIETMIPAYRSASRRLVPRVGGRLRLPGSSLARIPVRNVLRSLQRTILTVLALAAAVGALVAVLGMLDSFVATIDRGEQTALAGNPTRITADLEQPVPIGTGPMAAIGRDPIVAEWSPVLRLPATLEASAAADDPSPEIDVAIEIRALDGGVWRPNLDRPVVADLGTETDVVLAVKAARDLGVDVGDTVVLRHPVRRSGQLFDLVETDVRVAALHDIPLRTAAFVDVEHADLFGLDGFANAVDVVPEPAVGRDEVKRSLFGVPGVAAVQGVSETAEVFRDLMDEFLSFLVIVEGVAVVLALLVAYNATSINVDERQREHATMRAFGLPLPRIVRLMVAENALLGLLGSVAGLAVGAVLVDWIISFSVEETVPDLDIGPTLSTRSLMIALVIGTVTVALTPLLSIRRLRRADLPATLRVLE